MEKHYPLFTRMRAFWHCKRGNVAIMTAAALLPLLTVSLTGIEFADNLSVRWDISHAADKAVLAALIYKNQRWSDRRKQAQDVFLSNLQKRKRIKRLQTRMSYQVTPKGLVVNYSILADMEAMFGDITVFNSEQIAIESTALLPLATRENQNPRARLIANPSSGSGIIPYNPEQFPPA